MWVLIVDSRFSERTNNVVKHWINSPASTLLINNPYWRVLHTRHCVVNWWYNLLAGSARMYKTASQEVVFMHGPSFTFSIQIKALKCYCFDLPLWGIENYKANKSSPPKVASSQCFISEIQKKKKNWSKTACLLEH